MISQQETRQQFETLFDAQCELMKQVDDLRQWWREVDELGVPKYGEMVSRIQVLRDSVAAHFRSEEEGGYLAAALAIAPQFTQQAEILLAQHAGFLESLDRFATNLQADHPAFNSWQDVRDEFDKFVLEIRKHESAENAIMQAAFGEDIGNCD